MTIQCAAVRQMLQSQISPLFDCREEAGKLVIVTPFELPDGDLMEFFLTQEGGQLALTDMAETVATLASYRFDIESTPKRKKLFDDILKGLGIHYFQGQIRLPLSTDRDLVSGLLRLSQAALRTGDLLFTTRYGAGATFKDEVNEFLLERHVRNEQDYKTSGRSGQVYTLDFYIEREKPILIETLSTASSGYAEQMVNRTVRMWYDLKRADGRFQYATVLDDSEDVWRQQHFEILTSLSELVVWSERENLAVMAGAGRMES